MSDVVSGEGMSMGNSGDVGDSVFGALPQVPPIPDRFLRTVSRGGELADEFRFAISARSIADLELRRLWDLAVQMSGIRVRSTNTTTPLTLLPDFPQSFPHLYHYSDDEQRTFHLAPTLARTIDLSRFTFHDSTGMRVELLVPWIGEGGGYELNIEWFRSQVSDVMAEERTLFEVRDVPVLERDGEFVGEGSLRIPLPNEGQEIALLCTTKDQTLAVRVSQPIGYDSSDYVL